MRIKNDQKTKNFYGLFNFVIFCLNPSFNNLKCGTKSWHRIFYEFNYLLSFILLFGVRSFF